jgi:hypothetical protein
MTEPSGRLQVPAFRRPGQAAAPAYRTRAPHVGGVKVFLTPLAASSDPLGNRYTKFLSEIAI